MSARRTPTRLKSPKTVACALLGSLALVGSGILASPAQADPAVLPDPLTWDQTTPGQFEIAVPDGICSAYARVAGGAGNNQVSGSPDEAGGAGAWIDFTIPVVSGNTFSGVVGAGATSSAGAAPGGGSGGSGPGHRGGGGGGYSELLLGTDLLVLAGGGGGSGGGHAPLLGWGGNAGVPNGAGVFAGENGTAGQDASDGVPGAGQGGQAGGPGVGGVHSTTATLNGSPGIARDGGDGGDDTDLDTGAGGGGGFYGGGGGASTVGNGGQIGGAGGGGGSSYVSGDVVFGDAGLGGVGAPPPDGDDDPDNPDLPDVDGVNGAVGIAWIPCEYDLKIDKSVSAEKTYPNKPVTYTLKVTNLGEDPMGGGDTVTITDPMAVGGTIKSVKVSGGSGQDVTCTPGPGDTIVADITECSRPLPASASGVRGLDVGEVLTVTYTKKYTGLGTVENTASITDRGDPSNNESVATVKVVARPLPDTGRATSGSGGLLGVGGAALLAVATLGGWAVRRKDHAA